MRKLTEIVPEVLEDAVYQLNEYFDGKRTDFDLLLNPTGTDFSATGLEELIGNSLRKNGFHIYNYQKP